MFVPKRRGAVAHKTQAELDAMPERIDMWNKKHVPSCYVMSAGAGFGVPYDALRRDLYERYVAESTQRYPVPEMLVFTWTCGIFPPGEEILESDFPDEIIAESHGAPSSPPSPLIDSALLPEGMF